MSDGIIDIRRYLDGAEDDGPAAFALWGGEGERSRFALPLWRTIYLAGGDRGAILVRGAAGPEPVTVLDLRSDPARLEFPDTLLPATAPEARGTIVEDGSEEGLVVFLGSDDGRAWYLTVDGTRARARPLDARGREDILFLCGECAGLLFFRDLATP